MMILRRKMLFGMKSLSLRTSVLFIIFTLLLGVCVGQFFCNLAVGLITVEWKISFADIISAFVTVFGVLTTFTVVPYVVNIIIERKNSARSLIVQDIESICNSIRELQSGYSSLASRKKVSKQLYSQVLLNFKRLGSALSTLGTELTRSDMLPDFQRVVIEGSFPTLRKVCTKNLVYGKVLPVSDVMASQLALQSFHDSVNSYRYRVYD